MHAQACFGVGARRNFSPVLQILGQYLRLSCALRSSVRASCRCAQRDPHVAFAILLLRSNEDRLHRNLQRDGLEIADVISWEQIPMLDEDDNVAMISWPLILPHILASAPESENMHA